MEAIIPIKDDHKVVERTIQILAGISKIQSIHLINNCSHARISSLLRHLCTRYGKYIYYFSGIPGKGNAIRTAMKKIKLELGEPVDIEVVLEWEYSVPRQPDVVVDISMEWKFNEHLLQCYPSQLNRNDVQKLHGLNQYRGSMIGVEFAEAFKTNRFLPLRIDRLLKLPSAKKLLQ